MSITIKWDNPEVPLQTTIYKSDVVFDKDNLPNPLVTMPGHVIGYIDTYVEEGKVYYYMIKKDFGNNTHFSPLMKELYLHYKGPGSQEVLIGDWDRGYMGEVNEDEFIEASIFTRIIGDVNDGMTTFVNNSNETAFIKVTSNGRIYYIPKSSTLTSTWKNIYELGLMYGIDGNGYVPDGVEPTNQQKILEIRGIKYRVKCLPQLESNEGAQLYSKHLTEENEVNYELSGISELIESMDYKEANPLLMINKRLPYMKVGTLAFSLLDEEDNVRVYDRDDSSNSVISVEESANFLLILELIYEGDANLLEPNIDLGMGSGINVEYIIDVGGSKGNVYNTFDTLILSKTSGVTGYIEMGAAGIDNKVILANGTPGIYGPSGITNRMVAYNSELTVVIPQTSLGFSNISTAGVSFRDIVIFHSGVVSGGTSHTQRVNKYLVRVGGVYNIGINRINAHGTVIEDRAIFYGNGSISTNGSNRLTIINNLGTAVSTGLSSGTSRGRTGAATIKDVAIFAGGVKATGSSNYINFFNYSGSVVASQMQLDWTDGGGNGVDIANLATFIFGSRFAKINYNRTWISNKTGVPNIGRGGTTEKANPGSVRTH